MLNEIKKMISELDEMETILNDFNHEDFTVSSLAAKANDRLELFRSSLQDVMQPSLVELESKKIYEIIHNSSTDIVINNVVIDSIIFDKELVTYKLEDRSELIEMIEDFAREATGNDLELMKDDIEYLNGLNDGLVFSSISTNEYVAFSDDAYNFNAICKEILELNKTL